MCEMATRRLGVFWIIFEADRMTEPSIRRARKMFPPTPGTLAARFNEWPVAGEICQKYDLWAYLRFMS